MKSIKYLVAALAVAALATASYATVTVNWSTSGMTYLTDSGGNYVNGTDEIGVFSVAPTVGSSSLANFTALGSDVYSLGVLNSGSGFASSVFTAGANGHAQLYLVAIDQNGGEFIGYVNDAVASAWKLPADADLTPSTSFDLDSFFATPGQAGLATGATIVYGAQGIDSVTAGGPYTLLETVPEPSSIALVVIGLLGGIGMIRRRR